MEAKNGRFNRGGGRRYEYVISFYLGGSGNYGEERDRNGGTSSTKLMHKIS